MQSDQQRLERRFNSIRSLPKGQFIKYKDMFDLGGDKPKELKSSSNQHQMRDLKKFELEIGRIFEGVSDETNLLLSSLCSKNKQIADFFDHSTKLSHKENLNETSISSFLSDSSSSSSEELKKANSNLNIYTEIPNESEYTELKSSLDSSLTSVSFKTADRTYRTVQEPSENVITYTIDSDKDDLADSFKTQSTEFSSSFSLSSLSPLQKTDQLFSSTLSTIEPKNYIEIQDIDFSDESYLEDELISTKVEKTVKFASPPPKPARTFEHDIYLETKNNPIKNELDENEHIYERLLTVKLNKNDNSKRRMNHEFFNKLNVLNNKKNEFDLSSRKFALSEPNLTNIGIDKKLKNEKIRKPFEKLFNNFFKKTSHHKTESNDMEKPFRPKINRKQVNETVIMRTMNNNRNSNKNFVTKSYIYSDSIELNSTLFDYVLIVGLENRKYLSSDQLNSNDFVNKTNPTIKWQYPDNLTLVNPAIPEFCFPDSINFSEFGKNKSEIFQFTLTNIEGKRTYGYCIRLQRKSKNPIVICIISQIDALEMYYTILTEVDKIFIHGELESVKNLLRSLYPKPFPNRGESLLVTLGLADRKEIVLNRSLDRRLEHINLYTILNYPFDLIIRIFSAMLMEKKLIFLSNKLSSLSSTIQAFETLLYPFNWPHTYIPVLPSFLIDMTEAPTPYIIGLMRSCKNELLKYKNISDFLIIDLDKQKLIQDNSNQEDYIPETLKKCLKTDLNNLQNLSKNLSNYEKNVELCKIFLKFFVKTVGNYQNFFSYADKNNNESKIFKYAQFVNEAKTSELRKFLENFTQSQLFEVFVTKKIKSGFNFGLMFDDAIRLEQSQNTKFNASNAPPKITPTLKNLSKFYFKI
ncbi:unnamed protein product [Brachionus calyciflorus]|uniref:UDENN domain-containing protein n=1 Tax=Brachionus calyciflorus TaxID=104777 RepID=A0A814G6C9_9BILA|nr:unnamed protein product [Brachionus calyciflorus]